RALTFTWLLEPMFERTGFTIEVAEYSDDGFDARYLLRAASPQKGSTGRDWRYAISTMRRVPSAVGEEGEQCARTSRPVSASRPLVAPYVAGGLRGYGRGPVQEQSRPTGIRSVAKEGRWRSHSGGRESGCPADAIWPLASMLGTSGT